MKNGLKPTTGAVWRKPREEGELITLPSGNTARLRPVALDVLITSGELPDLLTPIAAKTLWTEVDIDSIAEVAETAAAAAELVGLVCRASFLEPHIVEEPTEDDEISLNDIDFTDKLAVFQIATQPVEVMRKFREEQERNVAAVSNGENNGDAAERVAEDSRSVGSVTV